MQGPTFEFLGVDEIGDALVVLLLGELGDDVDGQGQAEGRTAIE